jgi:hypothetical protein
VQGRRGFRIKVEGPLPEGAIVIPFPVNTVPGEEDNVNE